MTIKSVWLLPGGGLLLDKIDGTCEAWDHAREVAEGLLRQSQPTYDCAVSRGVLAFSPGHYPFNGERQKDEPLHVGGANQTIDQNLLEVGAILNNLWRTCGVLFWRALRH